MKYGIHLFAFAFALCLSSSTFAANDDSAASQKRGAVFVMTNAAGKNEILTYARSSSGMLSEYDHFATGGRGSGGLVDPLGSQGSLILNSEHSLLFAVNAGSGTVSEFRVEGASLSLLQTVHSDGAEPNALALWGNLLYVLNTGGSSSVTGFVIGHEGTLTPIPNSIRYLSTGLTAASSLAFSPNGQFLVVTERLTNNFDVFPVLEDGTLSPAVVIKDMAPGTFSLAFAPNGTLLVTETGAAGAVNGSTLSSFVIQVNGNLLPISAAVPTLGAATCWDAVTPDGRFVYTNNSSSGTISGFSVGGDGSLHTISQTVLAALPSGAANLDMSISENGKYLYSLNSGIGTISIFSINKTDGTLTAVGAIGGVASKAGFNGIAAY